MAAREAGGSNTFVPSFDATGAIISYTRNPESFRISDYAKYITVKKDQGYFAAINPDEAARIVNDEDSLWEDGEDDKDQNDGKNEFEFKPYRTQRRRFGFNIGYKAAEQCDWNILANFSATKVQKAMTQRTKLALDVATTAANWGSNTFDATTNYGLWSSSDENTLAIQNSINAAVRGITTATGAVVNNPKSLMIVIDPVLASLIAASPEYRSYIKGSPDALAALTDWSNPNRIFGLCPYLYGVRLVVEATNRVTTRKGGTQTRVNCMSSTKAVILSKPEGIPGADAVDAVDFSTLCFRFKEEMTIESKDDPDNRRHKGRVVEDYVVQLQAPETGFLLTNIA